MHQASELCCRDRDRSKIGDAVDANKLVKLKEIGYTIQKCCVLCKHSTFRLDDWGACALHQYNHLKHTGPPKPLSIHKLGWCPKGELDPTKTANLAKFLEFLGL